MATMQLSLQRPTTTLRLPCGNWAMDQMLFPVLVSAETCLKQLLVISFWIEQTILSSSTKVVVLIGDWSKVERLVILVVLKMFCLLTVKCKILLLLLLCHLTSVKMVAPLD
ncbi:hypothetical protein V8G54_016224 [Vigna mungo]|uniref:Uncharacterized protein n=1 Tax=Vigna mungo TaxID=3915 RepID=A0AAQ3RXM8_VIGMU